ncbi:MAG: aminotransferase class I/II-fold pyridoxal phosphate-dependent enzyme [Verrucomicrobiales bacterium]|nr:aminotransferase class I/II-fold pyridoxal phosphate-dependent enzyme [Verrucomicrobiales bacterium]
MSLTDKLADHIRALPRSGIREFFELVLQQGNVISLGVGEPDFVTPWHIREAAIYSLEKGQTSYTSNLGLLDLRKAISNYVSGHFRLRYDAASEVLVTVGVSEALDLAFRALLNPGDEVIYHEPCYVSYNPSIAMAHGVPVPVETRSEDDFALKAETVAAAITPRTKILMLNFPTNPTGAVLPRSELEKIADLAIRHDLIVFTDEIYTELMYDRPADWCSIAALPGMRERTILFHGFSKAFAMTGFRLGYACSPPELTEAMMKIHQYSMLCAPITSQAAGIEALENGAAAVEDMRREYQRRRNLVVRRLNDMGLACFKPGGAFYVFPDIRSTGLDSRAFATALLKEESVAVVPGTAFGRCGEGFVRCCYATDPAQLETAMERMDRFVARRSPVLA